MTGCCNERGCTRSQPFLILPSRLGDGWYLVTRYKRNEATGGVEAYEKHDITEQVEALLKREREAKT